MKMLNPFLEYKINDTTIEFKEKYGSGTSFLKINNKAGYSIDEIIGNEQLQKRVNLKLNYSFVNKSLEEYTLYEMLLKHVEDSNPHVDKNVLSKFLLRNVKKTKIEVLNFTKNKVLENRIKDYFSSLNGAEYTIFIVIGSNENLELKQLNNLIQGKGAAFFYKIKKNQINIIGPFFEIEDRRKDLFYKLYSLYKEAQPVLRINKQEEYFSREIDEVIIDSSIAGLVDYFSDYITEESPFFNRFFEINDQQVILYEKIPIKK